MVPISGDKTAWAAWSPELAAQARQRYEARQHRLVIEEREQAARLEAKAAMKLADLEAHTRPMETPSGTTSDQDAADKEMARKRAIIEAAMAKAKARQKT